MRWLVVFLNAVSWPGWMVYVHVITPLVDRIWPNPNRLKRKDR